MKHSDFYYELLTLRTSRTNTNANVFANENHTLSLNKLPE